MEFSLDYYSRALAFAKYNGHAMNMCSAGSQTRRGGSEDPPITLPGRRIFSTGLSRNPVSPNSVEQSESENLIDER